MTNEIEHHVVLSLSITGGFFGGTTLELADGLNCFIGGRGTGKTTLLEFLRYGLGLMPDQRVDSARFRAIDNLIKANLEGGRLAIDVRTRTGAQYTAERSASEPVQVRDALGQAVPVSLAREQIFGADVFSQNQIEEIAESPQSQLELIDRFFEAEATTISRELEAIDSILKQTMVELRRLDHDIEDLRATASERLVLEEKLKGLAPPAGPAADLLKAAHASKAIRGRQSGTQLRVAAALTKVAADVAAAASEYAATVTTAFDAELLTGPNAQAMQNMRQSALEFSQALTTHVNEISALAEGVVLRLARENDVLVQAHASQEVDYRLVVADSEAEGGRGIEREALQRRMTQVTEASTSLATKELLRKDILAKRRDAISRLSTLRDQRFAARKGVAESLNSQFAVIRVTVHQAADMSKYRAMVAEALKSPGIKQGVMADRVCSAMTPGELARAVLAQNHLTISERTGLEEERARRIVDLLRQAGAIYGIEAVDLEDAPQIELLDGGIYKASPNLSTGQRCTTILPIVLIQSERPLLIDQPEDNLDNAFIYDAIVRAVRDAKGRRQVIFVTHNPNIPVLGEADRVFVLTSDGKSGRVSVAGSVDECKVEIETILEGGKDAFLKRKERYGH